MLQQQLRQFKEKRTLGFAKRTASSGVAIAERDIVADGLQRLDGAMIGRQSWFCFAPRFQQPAGLPFPAIQCFRHLHLLGGESGALSERQSCVGLPVLLVKLSQVAERISFDRVIINLFSQFQRLLEQLL